MKKLYVWLLFLFAIGQVMGQTTYYSKSIATNFNDVTSWGDVADGSGTAPASISSADNFIIANGAILGLSGDALVRNLTINGGSLTVNASTLTVEIPAQKNASFTVNTGGAFIISGGNLNVNGNVYFADASSFTQSGGTITVDGNDAGNVATSVASTVDIFAIGRNSTNSFSGTLNLTGGIINVVDPHVHTIVGGGASNSGTAPGGNAFYYYSSNQAATSPNHTLQFGNGISADAGGNTAYGFSYNIWAATGRLYAGNIIVNTGSGVNRFVRPYWTGGVQEDLTITSGEFRMQTTFYVAGDVVNNGLFSNSSVLYLGTFLNAVAGSSTVPQTISGSGEFRNVVTGTTTANMASLTINNTNASGVTLTGYSAIAAQPTNSFSFSGTLNLINGRVSMASNAVCVVGIATPLTGTLNITNGGFVNGTTVARWWTNTGTGSATTAGTDPSAQAGRYPFLNNANEYRNAFLLRTTPTAGGLIAVTYNEVAGTTAVSITDGAYTVNTRTNDNWTVSALSGSPVAAAHVLSIVAPNAFGFPIASPSNARVVQSSSVVGTQQLGTTTPGGQRAGLSFADLTSGAFHLGINSSELLSATPDYVSLQWPPTITIVQGGSGTVYGQVYEAGLTDVVPNIDGQAPGIEMWVGISPIGQNTNPNTWTTWVPATWNSGFVGNNDEYQAAIGATLLPGTYYYATRFRLNGGPFVYGGIDASNNGNFWNGTVYLSGVLTVSPPPPPANDLCADALPLTVGANFAANATSGNIFAATSTAGLLPICQANAGFEVWYTVVVPASGNLTVETQQAPTSSMTDSVVTVYSGVCGALTQVGCDDDTGIGNMSLVNVTGQTPGSVLYVAIWKFSSTTAPIATTGGFQVSVYDCPSTIAAPTGDAAQAFCNAATVADLVATGTAIKWYASATGGIALLATDVLVNGQVYYASQTLACESFARLAVTVTINLTPAPIGDAAQDFCNETLANLSVAGTGVIWYDAATLGNVLPSTTVLVDGAIYYASQTLNGCESLTRLAVTVTDICPTTLINATAEGGFELGSTFAANGWAESSSVNNPWFVGTVAATGSLTGNVAYVSNTSGATHTYDIVTPCSNYFWRDVTIPAGESKIILTFNWYGQGESTWDMWQVFTAPTTVTPAGTITYPGNGLTAVPAGIAGATFVGSGNLQGTVQTATLLLPQSLAGTTFRLIFHWKSDTSAGTQPPAAIDNISLTSQVPGDFISIATGDWNNPATWDANAVPTAVDNAVVSVGHIVSVNAASLAIDNLIVNGTLNYGSVPTTFNVNGNLTVNTGGVVNVFNGTIGKTLVVTKDIINDGAIDVSVGATTAGNLTLNGSNVQSVSGTGNFGALNVIRNLTFSNTNTATPNINWLVNNIKIANNLNLTGARINLGTNKLTFGNAAAAGTLTAPVGTGFLPGGKFSRWWTATATGTAITAGTDPTNTTSRYPFLSATGLNRAMYITRTNATGAVAGELAVVYTDATTVTTGLTVVDGSYTVTDRFDGNWSVTDEGTPVSASSYTLAILAQNAYFAGNGNSRIMFANAPLSGAHQNGTTTPGAQRITVSQTDLLAGPLYIGLNADDVPHVSVVSGNWDNPTIWNKGTVPTCTSPVSIAPGTIVTVNSTGNNARNVTVFSTAELQVSSGDLTVGCTLNNNFLTNNGTLNVTGGTLNVNGQLLSNANSTFNQSSGQINVDGNNGGDATTSVPSATSIVQLNTNLLNWTGGTLTVVDPHANSTASNSFAYTSALGVNVDQAHTVRIGNGVSTDVGGNTTNGFRLNTWVSSGRITFGNLIIAGGNGTNRFVSSTYSFGINNDFTIETNSTYRGSVFTYLAGNLVNNGTYVNTSTLYLGTFLGGVAGTSSNAQTVSGTGVFDNSLTTPTANLVGMSVNNSNASGVTLSVPLRVSGTLTLVNGIVNTSATSVLSLGTSTFSAAGTLSGTPNATTYIAGPFERVIANSNSAYIQFPVGKTAYTPIWLAPTTTAASSFRAEAFNSNSGTLATSLQNLSANRWETSLIGGSFTAINARLGDSALTDGRLLVQAPTSAGVYDAAFGTVATFVAGTPNTIQSTTPVAFANSTGYYAHAELCTTPAPTGAAAQDFCNDTLADLVVTGTGIIWYDAATLGNVLPSTTVLVDGATYYASQTLNGCESLTRLAITVNEDCPLTGCLTGSQYPFATYTPAVCDGVEVNVIVIDAWAGEYSNVNVVLGQTYTFSSSVATDFITISDSTGAIVYANGTQSATWVSTITGTIRFYIHLNQACGTQNTARIRSIVCGIPSTDAPDYVSLQWPPAINIAQGGSGTVYGQVYEAGVTDVIPNIVGQAPGIQVWVGISPIGQNTNPNTWTTWVPATWNSGFVGNNDEYEATIGAALLPGTYYYATRFRLNSGPYVYGGIDSSNNGNFWNGTTFVSGVLTVSPPPAPANDLCANALPLTVGVNFAANPVSGTIFGATTTAALLPSCQANAGYEVWYTVVVPASGNLTIETQQTATNSMTDSVVTVYTGACGTLTQVGCDDDAGAGNMSLVNVTGLTPGATVYVAVWKWSTTAPTATTGGFQVSAYDANLSSGGFDEANFNYYPNPVTDILNVSYSDMISTVEVYNMIGQHVVTKRVNSTAGQIDMSQLPSGTYVIKVSSEEASKVIKVIKR